MQDIHLIGSGRIFTGVGGGGGDDHRLRHNHPQLQALKCPRCDSLNTKFCYYNNYNLSQPRHFCKSCRRYWTKGGVLRNVPVGGGCRKSSSSKRSSNNKPSKETKPKSNSNSSSESSNLSGTKTSKKTEAVAAVAVDLSAAPSTSAATPASADAASNVVFGFSDTEYIFPPVRNPNYSSELMNITDSSGVGGFTDIGKFTNMVTSSSNIATSCDVVSPFHMNLLPNEPQQQFGSQQVEHWQLREVADAAGVYVDPTVQIDKIYNNGSEPLNWQQQEQQMFGLSSAVDQSYWSQQMFGLLD